MQCLRKHVSRIDSGVGIMSHINSVQHDYILKQHVFVRNGRKKDKMWGDIVHGLWVTVGIAEGSLRGKFGEKGAIQVFQHQWLFKTEDVSKGEAEKRVKGDCQHESVIIYPTNTIDLDTGRVKQTESTNFIAMKKTNLRNGQGKDWWLL